VFLVPTAFEMHVKYFKIIFTPNFELQSGIFVDKLFGKLEVFLNPNFLTFWPEGQA
jgi:hypothetical protein